jgi:hypothetical protein
VPTVGSGGKKLVHNARAIGPDNKAGIVSATAEALATKVASKLGVAAPTITANAPPYPRQLQMRTFRCSSMCS